MLSVFIWHFIYIIYVQCEHIHDKIVNILKLTDTNYNTMYPVVWIYNNLYHPQFDTELYNQIYTAMNSERQILLEFACRRYLANHMTSKIRIVCLSLSSCDLQNVKWKYKQCNINFIYTICVRAIICLKWVWDFLFFSGWKTQ